MRIIKRVGLAIIILLIIAAAGFVIWGETPAKPMPEALSAMQSDAQVKVENGNWITFSPVGSTPNTGFIFYPGGRVDPRAYAPAARALAEAGYLTVIVPMPLNLAVLAPGKASQVMAAYPEVEHWVIGGHSLGGAMAANFVYKNPGKAEGLALWGSYPASSNNLSEADIAVVSISGTQDGLSTPAKIDASHSLLPASTGWVPITGGNHGQFGWYGQQSGDNLATIGHLEQQAQTVAATLKLLKQVSSD
jgi:Alpha/beta hydrolase family